MDEGKSATFITPSWKRGRPSTTSSPVEHSVERAKTKPRAVDSSPHEEIIKDRLNYMSTFDNKPNSRRCKRCSFIPHIYCNKCNVHLCFASGRECFCLKHIQ